MARIGLVGAAFRAHERVTRGALHNRVARDRASAVRLGLIRDMHKRVLRYSTTRRATARDFSPPSRCPSYVLPRAIAPVATHAPNSSSPRSLAAPLSTLLAYTFKPSLTATVAFTTHAARFCAETVPYSKPTHVHAIDTYE